ncbi:flagellar hook-basal body protein FliE [Skermanella stibiiresistens SB22]|jgi:flagellar hook-basal body complex protein FliE|uniref:Flagellar hook-basal body complex protein FliE n=1 Tax=Skermanella stibiiresistens SB22 TaxID=1385369 RepID=W9H091_9PROT|nr:flagellar hook-basal body complex protein FliE [Skermanella stibiiresistens]EWY37143.1 flagellar hook-basal body protein FliE [Skermanella stibiiresistens SB22]
MVASVANALSAYAKMAATGSSPGVAPADAGPSFASLVKDATVQGIGQLHKSEQISAAAVVGKADLTEVITAVTNAELTLQTATSVRDKVVQAYQEILRMPI